MKTTVTRISENRYSAVTDVLMSDGTYMADYLMRMDGAQLRSHEQHGCIRLGGLLKFNLGPKSLDSVLGLAVGHSVTLAN